MKTVACKNIFKYNQEMSEEDMDKLFATAQIRNRRDSAFSEVSEVMKIASGKWLELSEVTAEIT